MFWGFLSWKRRIWIYVRIFWFKAESGTITLNPFYSNFHFSFLGLKSLHFSYWTVHQLNTNAQNQRFILKKSWRFTIIFFTYLTIQRSKPYNFLCCLQWRSVIGGHGEVTLVVIVIHGHCQTSLWRGRLSRVPIWNVSLFK